MLMEKLLRRLAPVLLPVLFAGLSWGQSTSQLTGTVTDSTGAVIEGAAVRASNVNTGADRSTVTNDSGNYNIPFLPPGNYTINLTFALQVAGSRFQGLEEAQAFLLQEPGIYYRL